jgi:DNA-binding XRE family transcriptional regulator
MALRDGVRRSRGLAQKQHEAKPRDAGKRGRLLMEAAVRLLVEERARQGLSLETVAAQTGVSYQALSLIEKGARRPLGETFTNLCFALGLEPAMVMQAAQARVGR